MQTYDLLIVGGGINGAGIARDAAGRGLSVLLVEKGDIAHATSSRSSKLIHGGLRYLEQYDFALVAESLAEREVLLRTAGHLVGALRFVMPHVDSLRPRWMIRTGLFLYDHLGRLSRFGGDHSSRLPKSEAVRLDGTQWGAGLRAELRHGFVYSDCSVDDARLVVATLRDAKQHGADIRPRTEFVSAARGNDEWTVRVRMADGGLSELRARVLVNAAGPWVKEVLNERLGVPSPERVALVRGSHIVVPRLYSGNHAYLLQNIDRRIVFLIPFQDEYTLIGTTDAVHDADPEDPSATLEEERYLCEAANRYLAKPVLPANIVWRYAGVRPLYDDGSADPSSITRDYVLHLDAPAERAPALAVFGGKLTSYRHLAERVLDRLRPFFPDMAGAWTARAFLPGSDFGGQSPAEAYQALLRRYPALPPAIVQSIFRRHGMNATEVLGDASTPADLGELCGGQLTEREIRYFREHEWARTAEDILWRRTKAGLRLDARAQERVAALVGA